MKETKRSRPESQIDIIEVIPMEEENYDPMERTPHFFGGLIHDLKRRFPHYLSDFKDGLNLQVFGATLFIYFAALSGSLAFGGLLGERTEKLIGVSETLIFSSIFGIVFALLSGMPLVYIGVSGNVYLFDEALYALCKTYNWDFLAWRIWIGSWLILIALLVAMFQGSVLVRYFTKFTKDIFTSFLGFVFLYEAMKKLYYIFQTHPLTSSIEVQCFQNGSNNQSILFENPENSQPNTALLSTILMFMTFIIAYNLKQFKESYFLTQTVRKICGDFAVPISIFLMVLLDYFIKDVYTDKLDVPDGVQLTDPLKRSWIINPLPTSMPIWLPLAAIIPAFLLYFLLFMGTQICELLMIERTNAKGAGLHWDIVLICACNCIGAFFGSPWICASGVRSVSHITALTYVTETKSTAVFDQRVSFLLVSILLGLSILLSPLLKYIPYPVLFGVFLYMGITTLSATQMFDRLCLIFKAKEFHDTNLPYVKNVPTWKMNVYTLVQCIGLAVLWGVKSSPVALFFPFFIVAMIPLRFSLKFIFSLSELEAVSVSKLFTTLKQNFQFPNFTLSLMVKVLEEKSQKKLKRSNCPLLKTTIRISPPNKCILLSAFAF